MDNWLIWSNEHDAWWAPAQRGYVEKRSDAGRYPYDIALEIVKNANRYCGDKPNEAMIRDEQET